GVEHGRFSRASAGTAELKRERTRAGGDRRRWRHIVRLGLVALLALLIGYAAYRVYGGNAKLPTRLRSLLAPPIAVAPSFGDPIVVTPSGSIAAVLEGAAAGTTVMVEPGEYRERLVLRDGVRVVSRVARGATIRLPSTASEGYPAVVADGISGAELIGFRIVGDAATPLGTGIFARSADVAVVDVEIAGAANVAVDLSDAARLTLLASHVHDNPGAALAIRGGASPRISQNVFSRNGLSERVGTALVVEAGAQPTFFGNVFQGVAPSVLRALGEAAAVRVARDNWFMDSHDLQNRSSSVPPARRGR